MANLEKFMLLGKELGVHGRGVFSRVYKGFMLFSIDLMSCSWVMRRADIKIVENKQ